MKIEVGKYYKTVNGEKVGPAEDNGDGVYPFNVPHSGYFYGYTADGKSCVDCEGDNIISEWVDEEVGTLAELGVKAGDVVECVYEPFSSYIGKHMKININGNAEWDGGQIFTSELDARYGRTYRIISRADTTDTTPKTWGEMTDAEKGAIALEYVEGNVQVSVRSKTWAKAVHPFASSFYYRIKPEPKRETRSINHIYYDIKFSAFVIGKPEHNFYSGPFTVLVSTIDGEPDCGSVKMEVV